MQHSQHDLANSVTLRPPRPGDLGWVIHRHGVLYAQMGYDMRFESLVARAVADSFHDHDPQKERCWIAEDNGKIIGSIFLVKKSDRIGKLRMLYVEPDARNAGVGRRLIEECIRFARVAGYSKVELWTHSELTAARRLYGAAGFRLVSSESNFSFGKDLVDEIWEIDLA
jgi:GNAT superfamily N-acetyltransferase